MKTINTLICSLLILASCNPKQETKTDNTQLAPATDATAKAPVVIQSQVEQDSLKGSLKALATGRIGNTFVTINYHSPAVRGRVIWGGLVPLNQVWVTGAHMATSIEFEGPVQINGQSLTAGKYAFFTIPSKDEWTIIINKNWEQHLTDEYKQEEDVLRMIIKPEAAPFNQERLMYTIDEKGISVQWEKIKLSIPAILN